ncbi:MAG: metallophosphoesterase, partial [Candidatus Aenigmatarchaeota archaeon]
MQLKFLPERALLLGGGKEKTLVIADLHIGLELELSKKGITLPPQLPLLEKRIISLLDQSKAKKLILLGDIKHETSGIGWSELWDVPEFLQRLKRKVKIDIIKGNHDGGIEDIAPAGVKVHEPSGFLLDDILLAHGQAWPESAAAAKA